MTMLIDPIGKILGLVTLLAGGFVALVGIGCLALSVYGFKVGFHGGLPIEALMALIGAALFFVGGYCCRYGYRDMLKRHVP
jgi:hypothetical protein